MAESVVVVAKDDETGGAGEESKYDPDFDELAASLEDPSKLLITAENALEGDSGEPDPDEDTFNEQDSKEETEDETAAKTGADNDKVSTEDKATDEESETGEKTDDETAESDDTSGEDANARLLKLLEEQSREISELRKEMREMKFAAAKAEAAASPGKKTTTTGKDDSEQDDIDKLFGDDKDTKGEPEPSTVEVLENEIQAIARDKGSIFDLQLKTMAGTDEFKDVKEVCTQENFKDITEMITDVILQKDGGNYAERYLQVELSIWSRDNPFEYMYGLIKDHHPKFAKAATTDGETDDKDKKTEDKKETRKLEATDAPGSIQDIGSGSTNTATGWTSAKIDALPEDELHTVPRDVYDLYMQGRLK